MPSVVIIHAAENGPAAQALASKFDGMRLQTVLGLPPGDELRRAIEESDAAIALWSPNLVERPGLIAHADLAQKAGKLINAEIHRTQSPQQFAGSPTANLSGWQKEDSFPGWQNLARIVAQKTGVEPPPTPAPAPRPAAPQPAPPRPAPAPGGFFTPGPAAPPPDAPPVAQRPPPAPTFTPPPEPSPRPASADRPAPPPRSPLEDDYAAAPRRGANLAVIGVVTFLVVAALAVGGYFFYDRMQNSQAFAATWQALDQRDATALRQFIQACNGCDLENAAENALQQLEVERLEEARATDTIESLEAFLRDFPQSAHRLEVNGRISELRLTPPATTQDTAIPLDPALAAPPESAPPPMDAPRAGPILPGDPAPIAPPPQPSRAAEDPIPLQ